MQINSRFSLHFLVSKKIVFTTFNFHQLEIYEITQNVYVDIFIALLLIRQTERLVLTAVKSIKQPKTQETTF